MAFAAKNCSAHLGLERDLIVLAAVVADDLKPLRSVLTFRDLF
jgi:hypothetical protein